MASLFSLSFGGISVRISPALPEGEVAAKDNNFAIRGVRHLGDGGVEAEVLNFSGKIIISPEGRGSLASGGGDAEVENAGMSTREVVVDAVPEEQCSMPSFPPCEKFKVDGQVSCEEQTSALSSESSSLPGEIPGQNTGEDGGIFEHQSSFITAEEPQEPLVSPPPLRQLSVGIDNEDEQARPPTAIGNGDGGGGGADVTNINGGVCVGFDLANNQIIEEEAHDDADLCLHKACASDELEIEDLRRMLKTRPELASVQDNFGDYPAHVFANNDSFIYVECDDDVRRFVVELYRACPAAFLARGYDGQIPFAGTIMDWVDDCHTVYTRDSRSVRRVSEIKTLTKSTRLINSLCLREEVQRLLQLPTEVKLPVKVVYSFKMLSFLLDTLGESALEGISTRREFWATSSKRRDGIISSVASLPFLVRTILLIDDADQRGEILELSLVRNIVFRPESVDLWLVALLSGGERARDCAAEYLRLVSRSSLSRLFGSKPGWSRDDDRRFHSVREGLYREISALDGFVQCMLHLGDRLDEVSTRWAVKYAVESVIGRPMAVYIMFLEVFMLLLLMTSYRIIVELVWAMPQDQLLSQHREFWGLAFSVAIYFASRDLTILSSFMSIEGKLAWRYAISFGNITGYVTTVSVMASLSVMYVTGDVRGRNFVGIVSGLLWWKFLLHVKGMSQNLSTLIYTIMQIAIALKYFLAVFMVAIFFFADMIDIVKKTSGECNHDYSDAEMDSSLETFCSLTPLQSYLAMYGIMIGGFDISVLEGSSPLVALLFVGASFSGVIVLVNILIAIVTGEYEKARERSCILFSRARLEAAARQAARDKILNPPKDPTSGMRRKFGLVMGTVKYLSFITVAEYFLVESLRSCSALHKDGLIGDFLYVALILCAVLYNMFLVAYNMFLFTKSIGKYEAMRWLRGTKFHSVLHRICLLPVCLYVRSVGLGKGEPCLGGWDIEEEDGPLMHNEFLNKQADLESNIQESLKAFEMRMLHAMKSMMISSQIPPDFNQRQG